MERGSKIFAEGSKSKMLIVAEIGRKMLSPIFICKQINKIHLSLRGQTFALSLFFFLLRIRFLLPIKEMCVHT